MRRFVIPVSEDQLLEESNDNLYVQTHLTAEDVKDAIEEYRQLVEDGEYEVISRHFDAFFHCMRQASLVADSLRVTAWKVLMRAGKGLLSDARALLTEALARDVVDADLREALDAKQQAILIVFYFLCRFTHLFESQWISRQKIAGAIAGTASRRGRRGGVHSSASSRADDARPAIADWEDERRRVLDLLTRLASLSIPDADGRVRAGAIRFLWPTPVIDPDFLSLIAGVGYKLLENAELAKSSHRDLLHAIFSLLKDLVVNFGAHSNVAEKLVALLSRLDYLSSATHSPIADAICALNADGSLDPLLLSIFNELGRIDAPTLSKEGAGRALSLFVSGLAEGSPRLLSTALTSITPFLDTDPPTLRSAVLAAFVEIVLKVFRGDLPEDLRVQRDRLLARLKDHLHDVNATVRSRSVQLWTRLAEERHIPLSFIRQGLVAEIAERLTDKSVLVRKNAVHFICVFVENNPFGPNLIVEQLTALRAEWTDKRNRMKAMNPEFAGVRDAEGEFHALVAEVEGAIRNSVRRLRTRREDARAREDPLAEQDLECSLRHLNISQPDLVVGALATTMDFEHLPVEMWLKKIVEWLDSDEDRDAACDLYVQLCLSGRVVTLRRYVAESARGVLCSEDDEEMVVEIVGLLREHYIQQMVAMNSIAEANEIRHQDEISQYEADLREVNVKVRFYQEALNFVTELHSLLPRVTHLMRFGQTSEVAETIRFVVICRQFQVAGAEQAIREMCRLVWRKDATVKEAVVAAAQTLFLVDEKSAGEQGAALTARNLIALMRDAGSRDRASIDEIVCEMAKQRLISPEAMRHIWAYLDQRTEQPEGLAALKLIAMFARTERGSIKAKIDRLLEKGLGAHADRDFNFAAEACHAISMLGVKVDLKDAESIKREPFRLAEDDPLFLRVHDLLTRGFTRLEDPGWTPMMEHALNALFFLSRRPERIAARILADCLQALTTHMRFVVASRDDDVSDSRSGSCGRGVLKMDGKDAAARRDGQLVRVLALIGQLSLRMLIYIDVAYVGECKRQAMIREMNRSAANRRRSRHGMRSADTSAIEEDNDLAALAGATAEDVDQETAHRLLERELLGPDAMLGQAAKLVLHLLKQEIVTRIAPRVQAAAAVALAKLMLLSKEFCCEHARLFFELLRKSPLPSVRNNLLIAAADLCFRFPNTVEEYCERLYERIHDGDLAVRQTCLLVLTHLILNDMVKVKGCVADVARCTLDERADIAGLAKFFFAEMAQKGNTMYNLMPDMISRLSDCHTGVDKTQFKLIMRFLLQLIRKDKQNEMLVEKLCQRFQPTVQTDETASTVSAQYLSFCLTQLTINERAFRRLVDNVAIYGRCMTDREVYDNFVTTINAFKKNCKAIELRQEVEEFEETLAEIHSKGFEEEAAAERAVQFRARAKNQRGRKSPRKTPRKKEGKGSPRKKPRREGEIEEENEDESEMLNETGESG